MTRSRRSCLSVPGFEARMLEKATSLPADEVVIDLEDSVAPVHKAEARAAAAQALRAGGFKAECVSVRVNAVGTDWLEADVSEVAAAVDCIVLPKVESGDQVARVGTLLQSAEAGAERGLPVGLEVLVESALGLRRIDEIAAASERLEALIVGYADLAASLGRSALPGGPADGWDWVRDTVLTAARAAGLQAIDGPHLAIADADGLRSTALHARALGFDGKWALHPSQVAPLNEVFSPTRDELDHARAVVAALDGAGGRGAVMLDGDMVDEASRKRAADILARASAAGAPD